MNTKTVASLMFVASLSILSCKKDLQPQESSTDTTAVVNTASADPNAVVPTQVTPVQPNQVTQANQPVQINPSQMQVQPTGQPAKTAKGMNPPHGQPNHRCDIAVGAPLNSAPAKPAAPAQTVTPTMVQKGLPTATAAPVGVAASGSEVETPAGMNPPHGKPGHDCAVAVGAPLPKK